MPYNVQLFACGSHQDQERSPTKIKQKTKPPITDFFVLKLPPSSNEYFGTLAKQTHVKFTDDCHDQFLSVAQGEG